MACVLRFLFFVCWSVSNACALFVLYCVMMHGLCVLLLCVGVCACCVKMAVCTVCGLYSDIVWLLCYCVFALVCVLTLMRSMCVSMRVVARVVLCVCLCVGVCGVSFKVCGLLYLLCGIAWLPFCMCVLCVGACV